MGVPPVSTSGSASPRALGLGTLAGSASTALKAPSAGGGDLQGGGVRRVVEIEGSRDRRVGLVAGARLKGRPDRVGLVEGQLHVVGPDQGHASYGLADVMRKLFSPHATYNAGCTASFQIGMFFTDTVDHFLDQFVARLAA